MVPTITQITLMMKDLIEGKLNIGESKIEVTPYVSKSSLDILQSFFVSQHLFEAIILQSFLL